MPHNGSVDEKLTGYVWLLTSRKFRKAPQAFNRLSNCARSQNIVKMLDVLQVSKEKI
jgi:hypothetical protein